MTVRRGRIALTSGTVIDGIRDDVMDADVLISDGMIEAVIPCGARPADGYDAETIDARGLIVAPGFVDPHCHSDLTRFAYPGNESRVTQGITTEVVGNCGMSAAPTGYDAAALAAIIATIDVTPDTPRPWNSVAEWLDALGAASSSTNVAALVGHGSARHAAAPGAGAVLHETAMTRLRNEVMTALEAGCVGASLGLMYAPGESAGADELRTVGSAVADAGATLAVHLRDYDAKALGASVREAVAAAGDARLQLSHLRTTRSNGTFSRTIDEIEHFRADRDIAADGYPYTAGHTTLLQLLPSELRAGGPDAALALSVPELAAALGESGWLPEQILVMKAVETPDAVGVRADSQRSPWQWLARLLLANRARVDVAVESGAWADVDLALRTDWITIGSDGTALSPHHASSAPHPRSWGAFPAAFQRMRSLGVALPAAVRRMSVGSARRFGIPSGLVKGNPADVVVFAEERLSSNATFLNPSRPSTGIRDVFVQGVAVVTQGRVTGARPGQLFRRGASS
ncbi:N-acyl-D-amino-acid deacylase family protein [Microbacterium arabinogalactanolyticum]|uniref:N-acyl-D-amino-acid deacylase family protein n=1 Tax=Microbacterium arabinogalactanolyticum TaxID=69365 RepID=UPI0040444321